MKNCLRVIGLLVFGLIFTSLSYATDWHDLTQSERNQAIVDEANSWSDGVHGGQCKAWVQTVVYSASANSVYPPANATDYCYWQAHSYVMGRSSLIEYAQVGEIIQMRLKSAYGGGPHTAIIVAKDSNGITFKESNWCLSNCENVGTRYVTFTTFYNQVDCFTIYYIL